MGELSSLIVLGEHFLVNDSTAGDDHMRHLSLYYNNYTVYSKVDHCYGWNESMRMLFAKLNLSEFVCVCVCVCACVWACKCACMSVCVCMHVSLRACFRVHV